MAFAQITIDQAGLSPVGVPGSREDGLENGAVVTLKSGDATATTTEFELLAVAEGDTTAIGSLAPTGAPLTSLTWTFSPTAVIYGGWRVRLIVDRGLAGEDRIVKDFSVPTRYGDLIIPADNTRSDSSHNLVDIQPNAIKDSEIDNQGTSAFGWAPSGRKIIETVDFNFIEGVRSRSSGLRNPGDGVISQASATTIDVTAGTNALVTDFSNTDNPPNFDFDWDAFLGLTITNLSENITAIFLAFNGTVASILQRVPSSISDADFSDNILLGYVWSLDGVSINETNSFPSISVNNISDLYDGLSSLGAAIIEEGLDILDSTVGTGLELQITAGSAWKEGASFHTTGAQRSSKISLDATPVISNLALGLTNGSGGGPVIDSESTEIDPVQYEPGGLGALVNVSNNRYSNPRTYLIPGLSFILVMYGQAEYKTLEEAISVVFTEKFVTPSFVRSIGLWRSTISVRHNITDWSDPTTFFVTETFSGSGGGGGSGASTFEQLSDTPSPGGYIGNAGKFVAVNFTEDGLIYVDSGGAGNMQITGGGRIQNQLTVVVGAGSTAKMDFYHDGAEPLFMQLHDVAVPLVGNEVPLTQVRVPGNRALHSFDSKVDFAAGLVIALSSNERKFVATGNFFTVHGTFNA